MTEPKITKDGLFVPIELADSITIANLTETLSELNKDLKAFEDGEWMHPDDVVLNKEMIVAIEKVLWYYGESYH